MKTILMPYTKEETKEINRLWNIEKVSKKEREKYAISIGRTFTQASSKASYEKNKGNKPKTTLKVWNVEDTNYLMQEWPKRNAKGKKRLAKKLGRTQHALQSRYAKFLNKLINEQKPATLNVTHVDKVIPTKEATITIGEAVIAMPFRTFQVNGVKIDW